MTTLADFDVTDLVDDNLAATHNRLLGGIFRAEFANTETITATKELSDADCQFQFITASGANRTVELPPEATTNHLHVVYNSGASNSVPIKDDGGTITFATLAPDEYAICFPFNAEGWRVWKYLIETEYKISPTVSSNVITLKITHADGTDPTAFRPLACTINGTRRYMVAATSCSITTGNFFNLGAVEFATIEQQLFVYLVWDSNSSVVAISAARIPAGRLVSDFVATTTAEKYLFNYANFTSTDDVINIGRFNCTNSGTASFNWSVPSPTNKTVVHHPIYESDWLTWAPVYSATGSLTYTTVTTSFAKYKMVDGGALWELRASGTLGGTASTGLLATMPFDSAQMTAGFAASMGFGNTAGVGAFLFVTAGSPDKLTFSKYDNSNYATSGTAVINGAGFYEV